MENPQDNTPALSAVSATGQLVFADGSTRSIPHYEDPAYLILYLVRHGEKAQDDSKDPGLAPEGRARAEKLGRVMDNARIDKMAFTNLRRTTQTAQVVKFFAADPPVETFPPEAHNDWLAQTLDGGAGQKVFYVGHQNTIPLLLNTLCDSKRYKSIPDDAFNRFYIAITKGIGQTEVLELHY